MNRAALEGLRDALKARDWSRRNAVGAPELVSLLDALLEREPVSPHMVTEAVAHRWGQDGADTAWHEHEQARQLVENWSA